MRKLCLIMIALTLSVAMLATSVAPTMAASPETSKGSVKADLLHFVPSDPWNPASPPVGSVIMNTTASRRLQVSVNIDSVPNLEDWDILVMFWDLASLPSPAYLGLALDVLDTNAKGQGNAMTELDIPVQIVGDSILVAIWVAPDNSQPRNPPYAGGALVPLK